MVQQKVPSHSAEDFFGAPSGTLPRSKKRPAGAFLPAGTWDGRHELFSPPMVHQLYVPDYSNKKAALRFP